MMDQHFTVEDEAGNSLVAASSSQALLPVYADLRSDGRLSLLVINKSPSTTYAGTINVSGFSPMPNASVWTWGDTALAPYYVGAAAVPYADVDLSPTSGTLSSAGSSFAFTFAPYSLTILLCDPAGSLTPTPSQSPSPTRTPSRSATPSASPTRTASLSASATPTPSPSATTTSSPVLSPTPTASESPWLTATATPSASPVLSPTPSLSPSFTPTLSPVISPTSTPSASPPASPTLTPALTPTPSLSPAPTAAGAAAGVRLVDLRFMPQPNPQRLYFQVEGQAQRVQLEVYSPAYVLLYRQAWSGSWDPGWHSLALDAALPGSLGPGQRFAVLTASGAQDGSSKKLARLVILP
jgi:hypothetical protein